MDRVRDRVRYVVKIWLGLRSELESGWLKCLAVSHCAGAVGAVQRDDLGKTSCFLHPIRSISPYQTIRDVAETKPVPLRYYRGHVGGRCDVRRASNNVSSSAAKSCRVYD